jgi:hypothetical protein
MKADVKMYIPSRICPGYQVLSTDGEIKKQARNPGTCSINTSERLYVVQTGIVFVHHAVRIKLRGNINHALFG